MAASPPTAPARGVLHLSFVPQRPPQPVLWVEGPNLAHGPDLAGLLGDWPAGAVAEPPLPLWLPACGARPVPSPEARRHLQREVPAGTLGMALRPCGHPVLRADPGPLAERPRPHLPGVVWGGEWGAFDALLNLARALWARGSVLPTLRRSGPGYRCAWRAVLDDPVLAQAFIRWSAAAPGVLLAAGPPPPPERRGQHLRALLDLAVDALAASASAGAPPPAAEAPPREAEAALLHALGAFPHPLLPASRAMAGLRGRLDGLARSFEPAEAAGHVLSTRLELGPGSPGARLRWSVTPPEPAGSGPAVLPWPQAVAAGWVGPDAFRDRVAGAGPVARRAQAEAPVDEMVLDDGELSSFLTAEAGRLQRQGVRVLLPRELVHRGGALRLRARLGAAPVAGVGLQALYAVEWEVLLAGTPWSVGELLRRAEQRRPLVELHGRYVLVTPGELHTAAALIRMTLQRGLPLALLLERSLERRTGPVIDVEAADPGLSAVLAPAFGCPPPPPPLEPPPGLTGRLRGYQAEGFRWLAALADRGFGALLADEMGLGKTVQVIALLLHRRLAGRGPALVVAPTSVLSTWLGELARFAPGLRVLSYHGAARRLPRAAAPGEAPAACDVVVTSYGVLARDRDALGAWSWDTVVLDEAQFVKDPAAAAASAARALRAAARVALTGTPIENRLTDLWSIFAFLNPGYLGSLRSFRRRYAVPVERQGDPAAGRQLRARLAPFLLRRLKSDSGVAPDLPPRVHKVEPVLAGPEQLALYRATLDWLARRLAEAGPDERRGLVLGAVTRLKQILDHPALPVREPGPLDPDRSGKCRRLLELLAAAVEGGDRALVYTQFAALARQLAPLLARRLGVPVPLLWGGQGRAERDAALGAFRNAAGPCAMVLSLRAGGVGLNLPEASRVIHVDRWWNPAVEDQAAARAHRIGQLHPVVVHEMLTLGTVEERIHEMLLRKRRLSATVIGTEAEWLLSLDDPSLLTALAPTAAAGEEA